MKFSLGLLIILMASINNASALTGTCAIQNASVDEIKLLKDKKLVEYICECVNESMSMIRSGAAQTAYGNSRLGTLNQNSQRALLVLQSRPNGDALEKKAKACLRS